VLFLKGDRVGLFIFFNNVRMLNSNCLIKFTFSNIISPSLKLRYKLKRLWSVYLTLTLIDIKEIFKPMIICRPSCWLWKTLVKNCCVKLWYLDVSSASWLINWLTRRWTFDTTTWWGNCYFTVICQFTNKFLEDKEWSKFRVVMTSCHYIFFHKLIWCFSQVLVFLDSLKWRK